MVPQLHTKLILNCLIFSKIDPSENPTAAKYGSKSTINSDMKKMKLNAQITAVITLLEVLWNIGGGFLWFFNRKFMGHASFIQSILLYFVLLPYAFLMNTRHNKNRVIEEGWKNVFKNMFGSCRVLPLPGNEIEHISPGDTFPKSHVSSRRRKVAENNKQGTTNKNHLFYLMLRIG